MRNVGEGEYGYCTVLHGIEDEVRERGGMERKEVMERKEEIIRRKIAEREKLVVKMGLDGVHS